MYVLGITNNDLAGACLLRSAEVVAAVSEERFTRIKDHKIWPAESIAYVLRQGQVNLGKVDRIAYGWHSGFNAQKHLMLYVDRLIEEAGRDPSALPHLRKRIADELRNDRTRREELDKFACSSGIRVAYVDHPDAHAIGAFLLSPFSDALAVSCDGRGDFRSLTVTYCTSREQRTLSQETTIDS